MNYHRAVIRLSDGRADLSPTMRRARVGCLRAQAHLDALTGDPAARAWAEVMDALYAWVSEVPTPPIH